MKIAIDVRMIGPFSHVIARYAYNLIKGDVNDLASKLELLINDYDLRVELAKKGRQRVLNNFTQEKVAKDARKCERSNRNISIV